MKLQLDERRCEGYGFCEEKAPDLVELNEDGDLVVLVTGELEPASIEAAQKAVRSCPVAALRLSDAHAS